MQIIKPIKPVGVLTVEIVREISAVSKVLGLELLLVGAQAKVILLENIHGLNPGRATEDIDFAFAVESWDQFNDIKQSLIATSKFNELSKVKQRLVYQSSLINHGFIVDIIPFGKVQDANNMIAWPPELDVVMSVSGCKPPHTRLRNDFCAKVPHHTRKPPHTRLRKLTNTQLRHLFGKPPHTRLRNRKPVDLG